MYNVRPLYLAIKVRFDLLSFDEWDKYGRDIVWGANIKVRMTYF